MDEETICLRLARSRQAREKLAELFAHAASSAPLWHLVETHARFDIPLSTELTKEIVREHNTPAKRGRHGSAKEIGLQRADDMAAFLAVEYLMEQGLRITAACEQVGKLMGLTRQSVREACEREKRRPLKK